MDQTTPTPKLYSEEMTKLGYSISDDIQQLQPELCNVDKKCMVDYLTNLKQMLDARFLNSISEESDNNAVQIYRQEYERLCKLNLEQQESNSFKCNDMFDADTLSRILELSTIIRAKWPLADNLDTLKKFVRNTLMETLKEKGLHFSENCDFGNTLDSD